MAEFRYDISQLFNLAFSSIGDLARYDVSQGQPSKTIPAYPEIPAAEITESNVVSHFGTPIMFPITFNGGNYKKYNNGLIETIEMDSYRLPATTLTDIRRAKIIRKTRVSGGTGSIKELYGLDDYMIRIRGLIIHENPDTFPEAELQRIQEFGDLADSVSVSGGLFDLLKIYQIDINEVAYQQLKGYPNVLPFFIRAESNEPIELILP